MRKYLILFLLAASPASAQIKTITGGGYQYPNGSPCASCTLTLQLTIDATVSGTGQIVPKLLSYILDASGNVPSGSTIWGNDQLLPNGTTYKASLAAVGGGQLWGPEYLSIAGASPINLAQLIPVANPAVFFSNPAVTNLNNTFTGNNAFTGANTFSGGGSFRGMSTVNEVVYVCSKVAAYANQTIAAGITALSSNKGIIKVCDGHAETLTANLSIPGSAIIEFDGNATITQGAFQIIVAAGNDNVTIKSDFPISAHSNGTNSGVQFTGYTGTGAAVLLGASSAQTRNLKVENIGVSLASAGNGARCYEGDRLYEFKFHWDYCTIGSTATGNIGILLDGTGGFTGVGIIEGFNCSTGTSNNHVCLRGQNTVTRVVVEGGDYVNNSASGGVCWDANVAEFNFVNPNCNTASAGMLTVEGAGAHVTGTVSRDSTVTNPVVTFGAGTSGNYIFCATCAISDSTATNNGSFNTFLMNDGMIWQSNKWRAQCEATTCSFRDVTTGKAFVQSSTGGNLFLGNGTNQVTIANDDSINSFKFTTIGNCSSSASPAVCSSSAAGSVVVAAAATTVTVNTTAVTANSQILLTRDDSLGTKLSVTCNTATVMGEAKVSARVAGTSFTITVQTAPATNPGCFSYSIVN